MDYKKEFNVWEFEFWSGAREKAEDIRKRGRLDELGAMIESVFEGSCEPPDESAINDFVRFEAEPEALWLTRAEFAETHGESMARSVWDAWNPDEEDEKDEEE